ncbi:MAG: FAD:protein FMN transferase [Planctomycetes bacterium]|nr:FAD:protein FMN transferase [Planctomycetota bacterium]
MVRIGRRAMACQFQVFLNAGQYADGCPAALEALDLIERLEAQMTVYRADSEISTINREADTEPVVVEPRLFDLLLRSVELWRRTNGAFDITAGPLSEVWGFARRQGRMPQPQEISEAMECVGSQRLLLNESELTIRFEREGVQINLGAIGKGEALDQAAAVLQKDGIGDFLFHGGQSSVLARGSRAGSGDGGWTVGLIHPLHPQRRIGQIRLRDGALSTSGSGTQFFTHRGRRYGHILDPRTGRPAEGMLSCTVIAPTAAEADALSTALFVMGPQAAAEWCGVYQGLGAVLISPGRKTGTVQIEAIGMEDRWEPAPS